MPDYIFKDQSSREEMEVSIHSTSITVGITTSCENSHEHYEQNKILIFREEALQLARIIIEHFDQQDKSLQTNSIPIIINPAADATAP